MAWIENAVGRGTFGAVQVLTDSVGIPFSVTAIDVDGDADKDLVYSSADGVYWYRHEPLRFQSQDEPLFTNSSFVFSLDMDGDGVEEILRQRSGSLQVYQRDLDNTNFFGNSREFGWELGRDPISRFVGMDNDGSFELVTVSFGIDIPPQGDWPAMFMEVEAIFDVDGDGDVDVIGESSSAMVVRYNNGAGEFAPNTVSHSFEDPWLARSPADAISIPAASARSSVNLYVPAYRLVRLLGIRLGCRRQPLKGAAFWQGFNEPRFRLFDAERRFGGGIWRNA